MEGDQALAYVRARYTRQRQRHQSHRPSAGIPQLGDRQGRSSGTLLNPLKLVRFLDAATKSLTTDPGWRV